MPLAIVTQGTAWNQTMQMHMLAQVLAPGVKHRDHAHFAVEAFWVSCKRAQRLPGTLEQQSVNHLGMKLSPAIKTVR